MQLLLAAQLERLAGLLPEQLSYLPLTQTTTDTESGKPILVNVYHFALEDGGHKIVVQVARKVALGLIDSVSADGFVLCADGTRRGLTQEEVWEFA